MFLKYYCMKTITNNEIKSLVALSVLQGVMDPEIGLNVVDLGLIYRIHFDESVPDIFVSMTLTIQFCPMGESMVIAVTQALEQAFPGEKVRVKLSFDPAWTPVLISEEGQTFLNR